jgi:hypothetical protein
MSDPRDSVDENGPDGNPPEYKLEKFWDFSFAALRFSSVSIAPLEAVRVPFMYNVAGVKAQLVFLIFALNFARELERLEVIAEHELTGTISDEVCSSVRSDPLMRRIQELYNIANARIIEREKRGDGSNIQFQMHDMFMRLNLVVKGMPELVSMGAERYLGSMLLGVWTAFETLAGDLWETALNIHPRILSDLKTGDKSVPINQVQRYGYDLREKMGTILKKKYNFDRLDGIREGYEEAFNIDSAKIQAALSDKSLDTLSALRNVIVHRGAVADAEFVNRSKSLPLPKFAIGERIRLDGDLIVPPMQQAIKAGDSLLVAVDEWIVQHQS